MLRYSLLIVVFSLGLASCTATNSQTLSQETLSQETPSQVAVGSEVTLQPSATAEFKQAGIHIQFVAITEDSRCPRDATCVWAGQVKVQLAIRSGAQKTTTQQEVLEGESVVVDAYRVTVVRVHPAPSSTGKTPTEKYRATLRLERK